MPLKTAAEAAADVAAFKADLAADTARWAEEFRAALRTHSVTAFLAAEQVCFEAKYRQATAVALDQGVVFLRYHGEQPGQLPRSPATDMDRARAADLMRSLVGQLNALPPLTRAQKARVRALDELGGEDVKSYRGEALDYATRAEPPLAGGSGNYAWARFSIAATACAYALCEIGETERAEQLQRALVALGPRDRVPRWVLAGIFEEKGDLTSAWAQARHGAHIRNPWVLRSRFGDLPPWDAGEPIGRRTLLIAADAGLGDQIQHSRYVRPLAALAAQSGGRVVVEVPGPLVRLYRATFAGVAEVCEAPSAAVAVSPARFDAWCLPNDPAELFANEASELAHDAYLSTDPQLLERWRQVIDQEPDGRLRVGLNWAGSPESAQDGRTMALAELAPLAKVPGVALYALTKSSAPSPGRWAYPAGGDPETEPAPEGMQLVRLGPQFEDMADSAAAMMSLDLVITIDTAIAHLGGALGRPVWLMLNARSDRRWRRERAGSFWYPSLRIFQQAKRGAWGPVVARVRRELAGLVRHRRDDPR